MARSIWSGTISCGLVSVPVRMVGATESKELRFHFLHKKNGSYSPIGYAEKPYKLLVEALEQTQGWAALRASIEQTKKSKARVAKKKPARKAS